jgi:malonate transporter and related proteins
LLQHFALSAPLFLTVLTGYALARLAFFRPAFTRFGTQVVFGVVMPALLFHIMSDLRSLPPVDARLLLAFFGGCGVTFTLARWLGARVFAMDGVAQSVFALGGVFSNNVLLGLPLAKSLLGPASLPCVALVLVFNSLALWTLVTVSVEWARQGSLTRAGLQKTIAAVLRSPIILAILTGTAFGLAGYRLPPLIDHALALVSQSAAPLSLLVLGMGLAEHGFNREWRQSAALCGVKLGLQPLVVLVLALVLRLPPLETSVVVLLASISIGVNVYLMAAQFQRLESTIASSMLWSTALAAVTTPLWVWFTGLVR